MSLVYFFLYQKPFQLFLNTLPQYQALQTRVGHNATRYHNLNALQHVLPYIFSRFSKVWGCLQRVTNIYYIYCIWFFFI